MNGRTPTKAEAHWMQNARSLGCIVCINNGEIAPFTVPEEYTAIHHIKGQRATDAHFLTLPLCARHHQTSDEALHYNKSAFQKKNGTEMELLAEVERLIDEADVLTDEAP